MRYYENSRVMCWLAIFLISTLSRISEAFSLAAPPAGFVLDNIAGGWHEPIGTTFMPDGRAIVWERSGRVWIVNTDGTRSATPLLDIHDEVGGWRDYGLLSVVLDPNFEANGWIYLLYVVDRHHLDFAGTAEYSPTTDHYYAATIGRITRYTATPASGRSLADPASRQVILGATASTGIPVVHQSHGPGSLAFGEDGTLLVTTGDAASYAQVDVGGQVDQGYVNDGLARGILRAKENVGAFRSQLVDCLCGKILRLDPATGDGIPSNPYFDASDPRAAASRIWALGLRNPFRMQILPGSGSHNPAEGDPGTVYVGDVGWAQWEEVSSYVGPAGTCGLPQCNCDSPSRNFGWPLFEGLEFHDAYWRASPANPDAPTGLSTPGQTLHLFRDLIHQESLDPTASLPLDPTKFLQAEAASANGAPVSSQYVGYQGFGYRDFQNATGEWIEFSFMAPIDGNFTAFVRYANGEATSRALRVSVNGEIVISSLPFSSTEIWREWRLQPISLTLSAGVNVIRFTAIGQSGPNVDSIAIVGDAGASAPTLEVSAVRSWGHCRPRIDWNHSSTQARTPTYASNAATATLVGAVGGASGSPFAGYCAIGGPLVTAANWPSPFKDALFFGDFSGWIRSIGISTTGSVTDVATFDADVPGLASIALHPFDGSLWITRFYGAVSRYRYAPNLNLPPVARLASTESFGPSPLTVTLSAAASTDPEGTALTYLWNFGDGATPVAGPATVTRTYFSEAGVPTRFDPIVTVTDAAGQSHTATALVSVNNTPPVVNITSLIDGQLYPMDSETIFNCEAAISDAEHGAGERMCSWLTILHHNNHQHSEQPDFNCATSTVISALGCGAEMYSFEVRLTVTDAAGLSVTDAVRLYPDCEGVLVCPADLNDDGNIDGEDLTMMLSDWDTAGAADIDHSGTVGGADLTLLLSSWGACP